MTSIELRSVSKSFSGQYALKNVSLQIRSGERVAVIGPSGSGKSTLLRLVAGLEPTTSGYLNLGTADAATIPPQQRNIGMLFQQESLYPHMSVAENIRFAKPKPADVESWKKRFDELVAWMELESLLHRMPQQLSGGEQQRVALARALIRSPRILLLDEPLSHLDRRLSRAVQNQILAAQSRFNITMLYVTHDLDEALAFADRLVVLHQGELVQLGTPQELLANPTPFVRDFLDLERYSQSYGECWRSDGNVSIHLQPLEFRLTAENESAGSTNSNSSTKDKAVPTEKILCHVRLLNWKVTNP